MTLKKGKFKAGFKKAASAMFPRMGMEEVKMNEEAMRRNEEIWKTVRAVNKKKR